MTNQDISPHWYWGLPLLLYITPYAANGLGVGASVLQGEQGAVELGTVLLLFIAIYYAVSSLRVVTVRFKTHPRQTPLKAWLVMMIAGAVYFGGEELSWGQHLLGWETPAGWSDLNDQRETNLHNTHAVFDQLPRMALTLAIFIGGLLVPLYCRLRARTWEPTTLLYWLMPTWVCVPTALCLIPLKLIETLVNQQFLPQWLDISAGEIKEMLIALFIMLYLASLHKRIRNHRSGSILLSPN